MAPGTGRVGGAGVTTHSFPKTVAALTDGGGLSATIRADHLGHPHVSVMHDRYMARGRSEVESADLLHRATSGDPGSASDVGRLGLEPGPTDPTFAR
jgi:integrase